mgnify:FL=1
MDEDVKFEKLAQMTVGFTGAIWQICSTSLRCWLPAAIVP